MKITSTKMIRLISLFLLWQLGMAAPDQAPKLTVVLIVDQLAYHYFPKLQHNFKYGFKKLLNNGIVYTNALHPHGIPETTPGHLALSTGCYPKDHGGITNQWLDQEGNKISFEADKDPTAAIIPKEQNKSTMGKSDYQAMVDTLSDQFSLYNTPSTPTKVFALSIKPYSAIATAGKMGKAVWFDEQRGIFVSSKKYFSKLPSKIAAFNKGIVHKYADYNWNPCYKLNSPAYQYPHIKNYTFAGAQESYVGKSYRTLTKSKISLFSFLIKTPIANTMMLDLAKSCINQHLNTQTNDRMLLWVSLSQLDLLTHLFGPDSLETIDTIYHLDRQIDDFITFLHRKVGANNCLFVLTADHGIAPIPEIQQLKGFSSARRIIAKQLIEDMNKEIKKRFGITNIVKAFEPNSFRLDHKVFGSLKHNKQDALLISLRNFLRKHPGIQNAWTYQELATTDVRLNQFASFYKMQLFSGRIGELICQPAPYCQITNYATGTSHSTPYDYDTHVPLILYQPGKLNHKIIQHKVFIPQLPVTLAYLLHITKPSASPFDRLPGC